MKFNHEQSLMFDLIAHGEMKIRLYPDPILRRLCDPVTEFGEPLTRLLQKMREFMALAGGVGLAAPQIGLGLQIAVFKDGPSLINPACEALDPGEVKDYDYEGCLSIPGFQAKVGRVRKVKVHSVSVTGEPMVTKPEGFLARVVLHEIDHLNGILFTDHLRGMFEADAVAHLEKMRKGEGS